MKEAFYPKITQNYINTKNKHNYKTNTFFAKLRI